MKSTYYDSGSTNYAFPHTLSNEFIFWTVKNRFDNTPKPNKTTWREFCSSLRHVERHEKDGPGFIFNELDGKGRKKENVLSITAIALDIERQDTSPPPAEEFADHLKAAGCVSLLYTTFSHLPEAARYRLIFPIDRPIKPCALEKATHWVMNRLALSGCTDPASWQPARLMYAPACPPKSPSLVAFNIEGEMLSADFLESLDNTTIPAPERRQFGDSPQVEYAGEQNGTPYGLAALDSECQIVLTAPPKQSNNTLNNAAIKMGSLVATGQIEENYARNRLYEAAMRRKPGCHDEVTATINSGFNEGLKSPRRSQQSNSAKFSNLEFPLRTPPKSKIAKTNIEVQLRRGADIKPLPIHWLWRGWIACGKLSLLAGNAGTGKTTLALAIASVITRGGLFPDGSPCERAGNVLIWSGEDVADDTLVPRLIASGADMHRCFFIEGVNKNGESIPFDPAMHIATLHDVCVKIGGASLMIVDPIVSAVSGDMYRPNDVRRSLQAIVDFAEIHQCAVIGITHFTKGSAGASPLDRILGSQAFVGLARLALVAAKEESGSRRILARAKSNIGKDMGGIAYSLNTTYIAPEIEVSHVVWGEAIEGSAREILNDVENVIGEDEFKRDAAKDFLRNKLRNGAIQVNQLKNEAGEANLKWRTVERAKSDLGVKANKAGLDGGWFWTLPAP